MIKESKYREEMPYGKVFGSDMIRTHNESNINLYDILRIDPVEPVKQVNNNKKINCDFVPNTNKHFVPKKKNRFKVKTVRDIRNLFEKDMYSTIEKDLEKQNNNLIRKIRGGASKDEKTKLLARDILRSENPISSVVWQMVINVNPDDHIHSSQYVLWNGKEIQVNGSRGGTSKFICKYDLGKQRTTLTHRNEFETNSTTKRYLLKNSSNVKLKPHQVSGKKHNEYNIGGFELTHLPKAGLDIRPKYGKPLESSITNILHQLRDVNGIISDKWAEFAVSTLGTEENGRAKQLNKDCCVTFDLKYKYQSLKTKKREERILSVVDIKLNCANIEPWCMIHNLYKCFCKGKFTERLTNFVLNEETQIKDNSNNITEAVNVEIDLNVRNVESTTKIALRPRIRQGAKSATLPSANIKHVFSEKQSYQEQCARTEVYSGRKYSPSHYSNANKKIKEMEKDDHRLRKRMMDILKTDEIIASKRSKTDSPIMNLSASPVPSGSDEQHFETKEIIQNEILINSPACDRLSTDSTSPILNTKSGLWLEPLLNMYRHRLNQGFSINSLEPPLVGKVALYPWHFMLNRYQNRKNIFLVSKHKPSRIYMAINSEHVMFENCINVRDVVNLEKYPVSVRNIITNNTEGLKDQLCILRGLECCWELIGSIKKMSEIKNNEGEQSFIQSAFDGPSSSGTELSTQNSLHHITSPATSTTISVENSTAQSRWFVMTVENDFDEMQFYNRGFYVKFECIIEAVNIARTSEKTVRLSSQKGIEEDTGPQFGLYVIPIENEHCAIIGPYDKNEPLGIETIKTGLYSGKKRTRGVWMTTNKVDNLRVITNPLHFIETLNIEQEEVLDDILQGGRNINTVFSIENSKNEVVKLPKPIKIKKTNNFYHLTSSGVLIQVGGSPEKQYFIPEIQYKINKNLLRNPDKTVPNAPILSKSLLLQTNKNNEPSKSEENSTKHCKRSIAEIAPQVKVTVECSENTTQSEQLKTISTRKSNGCMFILKPEEINKRCLANNVNSKTLDNSNAASVLNDSEIEMDIEHFLANSVECTAPSIDLYVTSDDEDYCNIEINSNKNCIEENWKDVWVISKNVENIGWISGRQDANKHLSFEIPGFKYSEFYPIEEAFATINQVLSQKMCIPKHIDLSWCVIETKKDLKNKQKLKQEDLCPDFMLTKHGLMHKSKIAERKKSRFCRFIFSKFHNFSKQNKHKRKFWY